MSEAAQGILKNQQRLATERAGYDRTWQQIAERCAPDLAHFTSAPGLPGTADTSKQFDSTAALASVSFAAALMGMIVPREKKWHGLRSGIAELDSRPEVQAYFEDVRDRLFYYRYAARSNFANQFHATMLSMGLFGPGALFIDEDARSNSSRLVYRNVPAAEIWIEEDEYGRVDTVYRRARMPASGWVQRWGDAALQLRAVAQKIEQKRGHEELEFVQVIAPRAEVDPDAIDGRQLAFESRIVGVDDSEIFHSGGYATLPITVGRFTALSNARYGRSPALQALPDIKMVNEMQKTLLRAAHRAVTPPLLVHDDGILTRISLKPDAVNVGGISPQGKQMVQPLMMGGQIGSGMEMVEAARKVIEQAFLVPLFSILSDTPDRMTATEVLERAQEKGMLLNPAAGVIEAEILGPVIEREISLLAAMGLMPAKMPDALREVQGEYRITYDNPLQRAARSERSIGFLRTLEALTPIMNAGGPEAVQEVMGMFDMDQVVRGLAEDNGVPQAWMTSAEDRNAQREAAKQGAEAQQLLAGAQLAGDAARSMAEAQTAMAGVMP